MITTTKTRIALILAALMAIPALAGVSAELASNDAEGAEALVASPAGITTPYSFGGSDVATGLDHVTNLKNGFDIRGSRVVGDHFFAVGHSGFFVFDISDRENPVEVAFDFCPGRDIAVSGAWAAIIREGGRCHGRSSQGVAMYDVSDPTDPVFTKQFTMATHTIAAYGDQEIFHVASQVLTPYLGGSIISSGSQAIIDARGASPVLAPTFQFPTVAENGDPVNAPSCHEVWFNVDIKRGYCAGVTETHIWDTTDPLKPKILSVIKNPNISIHHSARTNADGTILIINDEEGGALVPACYYGSLGRTPRGALWFYDVSNEALPLLQSWISIPTPISPFQVETRCTSHYGEVLQNDHQAVWAWYGGAAVLIDFSNVLLPTIVDAQFLPSADTWGANLHPDGYVYAGDMRRGVDVYRFTT